MHCSRLQGRGVKMKPVVKRPREIGTTDKPLAGRVFYLDITSKLITEKLEKDIKDLGGTVEGFLSKEISYLITSKMEAKCRKSYKYSCSLSSSEPAQNAGSSPALPESHRVGTQDGGSRQKPEKDDVSRGKYLLKKVFKEQEMLPKNCILASAWNWGVRILHVDEAKMYIEKKKRLLKRDKKPTEVASIPVVSQSKRQKSKAHRLREPYIKVEDDGCLYSPFYIANPQLQSFQTPAPKKHQTKGKKPATKKGLHNLDESEAKMRMRKRHGYCECCQKKYNDLEAHLVSEQHRNFAQGPDYRGVDIIISKLKSDFVDWSLYKPTRSSVFMHTVTSNCAEKEIMENNEQYFQKLYSPVKQTPEILQRTELQFPIAAANVNNTNQSPGPMDPNICSVQTVDNNGAVADSYYIPPGTPAVLLFSESSWTPYHKPILSHLEDSKQNGNYSSVCIPQALTLSKSVAAMPIQKLSPEPVNERPSKMIKLDESLVSVTLHSGPVDNADHVTHPKPVIDTVPEGLKEPRSANHSDALQDPNLHSSPSKLNRKVKSVRKVRKQEDVCAPSVLKMSVPEEEYEFSSATERLRSVFQTSEGQLEFCGFSTKSESLPCVVDIKEKRSSSIDMSWCLFSNTSSTGTFYGF